MADGDAQRLDEGAAKARAARRKRRLRPFLLVVVPTVAVLAGLWWWAMSGRYVATENAYVKADIVAIASRIDGRVAEVLVLENQIVDAGDLLFQIDPEPFQIAVEMAEAEVLDTRNEIEARRAEFRQVAAEIEEARERVDFFDSQARRQRQLQQRGIAAQAQLDEAEMEQMASRQRVSALQEKLRTVLAGLGGDPESAVELHPAYRAAEAERTMAELELGYTEVRAPIAGIVSRMRLQPGEWVEEGEPAFSIIDPASIYIEANLKETQLEHVGVGQQVEVEVDAYPSHVWRGEVQSISPATGAEFAVIPPQNATGNWVKVVQRLPIRIRVEAPDNMPPLRAGMTAAISIDTEREPELAQLIQGAVARVSGSSDDEE
jgi:membrane fusion protein (multidrug efflux system)